MHSSRDTQIQVVFEGKRLTLKELAAKTKIPYKTVWDWVAVRKMTGKALVARIEKRRRWEGRNGTGNPEVLPV